MTILARALAATLLLSLSNAAPLRADALADLRATLAKLASHAPVRASAEIHFARTVTEDKTPKTTQGKIAFGLQDGPAGLEVSWPRELFDRAAAEAAARNRNPEKPAPTRAAIGEIDPLDLADFLGYAPTLLRDLDEAKLVAVRPDASLGRPARVVELAVEPKLPASEKKYVKELKVTTRVWIGDDGVPIAYVSGYAFKGSRMFISFEGGEESDLRFQRVGDRLVATQVVTTSRGSGFGQSSETKKTIRITPS